MRRDGLQYHVLVDTQQAQSSSISERTGLQTKGSASKSETVAVDDSCEPYRDSLGIIRRRSVCTAAAQYGMAWYCTKGLSELIHEPFSIAGES
jgi:hypothetical protein